MKPHETKKTLSLNEARNCIIAMSKPMGQAVQLIEINLRKIKEVTMVTLIQLNISQDRIVIVLCSVLLISKK